MECQINVGAIVNHLFIIARAIAQIGTILVLAVFSPTGYGAEANEQNSLEQQENTLPDLEFLEFLGSFETDSGEWVNPENLASEDFDALLSSALEAGQESSQDNEQSDPC